jgi:hypothetical protein
MTKSKVGQDEMQEEKEKKGLEKSGWDAKTTGAGSCN